jgi:hypothetical protein
MKTNGNEPINPIFDQRGYPRNARLLNEVDFNPAIGLTKREYFAAMAMQAVLHDFGDIETVSKKSILYADALIEELNK